VKAIKRDFIKQVLDQQPDRRERFKAHDFSQSEPFPTKVTILDFTSLGDVGPRPFRDESYILVRQEYKEVMKILESGDVGGEGSMYVTGQPGIGEFNMGSVHAQRDVDTVHRQKLFSLGHSFAALEGQTDDALSDQKLLVSL
jgi:hypothetical protein